MTFLKAYSGNVIPRDQLHLEDGATIAVSPSGQGILRYNDTTKTFQVSVDGGPYQDLPGNAFLSQPVWHVNALTGSDSADGKTAGTALATFAEWTRRIARGVVTVACIVFLDSDLAEAGYVIDGTFPLGLTIQGQRTVLHSGVVSSLVGYDFAVSPIVAGSFEDATLTGTSWDDSGPGGTSLVNKFVVLTSGALSGAGGWVAKDLGAKVCRPTPTFVDADTFANGFPANTDTFDVCDLTKIEGGPLFFLQGAGGGSLSSLNPVTVRDCELLGDPAVNFGATVVARQPYSIYDSVIGAATQECPGGSFSSIVNCLYDNGAFTYQVRDGVLFVNGGLNHTQFRTAAVGAEIYLGLNVLSQFLTGIPSNVVFRADDGGRITLFSSANLLLCDEQRANASVLNCTSGSIILLRGQAFSLNQGGVGYGIWVDAGGQVFWDDDPDPLAADHMNFDAPLVDVSVGGTAQTVAGLAGTGFANLANLAVVAPRERLP